MRPLAIFSLLLLLVSGLFAQATQTGSVAGTVETNDGGAIPGVTVTATSPILQGERTAYTGDTGQYILRGLPPGLYAITFSLEGLAPVTVQASVALGQTARVEARMVPKASSEAITVVAKRPSALSTTQIGTNITGGEIQGLPIPRTQGFLGNVAALAPGITPSRVAGQVRINGGFGYDNIFFVDGAEVEDNIFGTPYNLFIEDAIADVQVLTAGVSAEYGRFTGGIINVVTKSGGNDFSGSARADLANFGWRDETPAEDVRKITRSSRRNHTYSATLGGPVRRDLLWFFLSGRDEDSGEPRILAQSRVPFDLGLESTRYEGKLTATVTNHSLQASHLSNRTEQSNLGLGGRTIDARALVTRTQINRRWSALYNGLARANIFSEVRYSRKDTGLRDTGGTSTNIVDSPFLTRAYITSRHYNAPYFDSSDPEDRDNSDVTANISWYLSTRRLGDHDLKSGVERYVSSRVGGNSQSATSFIFYTDYKTTDGTITGAPALDAQGRLIPVFRTYFPGQLFSYLVNWLPVKGAEVDLVTQSLFVQDEWTINRHVRLNIGARYEMVRGEATGDITTTDTNRLTPRVALSLDPMGNGRFKVDATFAHYGGKFMESQFARNTNVGRPNYVTMYYLGPRGEGIDFAPAFNLKNYEIASGHFPNQNVTVDPNLRSPIAVERTLTGGAALGGAGFVTVSYVNRVWRDLFEDFIDRTTGSSTIRITPEITREVDNIHLRNTNLLKREYSALQLLSQVRPMRDWSIHGHYTYEMKNDGNFVGDTGDPTSPSLQGNYPGVYNAARHFPSGRLPGYQKHRLRVLNNYSMTLSRFGMLDVGLVFLYDSPLTFSYIATRVPPTSVQRANATKAGYITRPGLQTIYFGERGSGTAGDPQNQFDLALSFSAPLFGRLAPWLKAEVYNVMNQKAVRGFNTAIEVDPDSPKDALGLPTGFIKDRNFGRSTTAAHYQAPREYRISAGVRF